MTVGRVVRARLLRLSAGLRDVASPRRRERRFWTYALRMISVALLLVALPLVKIVQLGPLDAILAFAKVALAVAIVAALFGAMFAVQELERRRRLGGGSGA